MLRCPHSPIIAGMILTVQALAAPALAESTDRETSLIVYGDDPCPQPRDSEEIVVCARRPEEERYRIPPRLRRRQDELSETSWAARSWELEEAQRFTRPNSCSVVGTGGQTGCTQAMIRQWQAERRAAAAEAAGTP